MSNQSTHVSYGSWVLLLALALIWGTSFLFTSIGLETFSPLFITFFRLVCGAAVLTCLVYIKHLRLPFSLKDWGTFFVLGLVGNAAPFFLIAWGQQSVPSGLAGVLMAIMPIMTMLIAHFTVVGETLSRYKLAGAATAFIGVAILLNPSLANTGLLVHQLCILAAASCYALNAVLVRRLSKHHPMVGGAGMLIASSLIALPFFISQGLDQLSMANLMTASFLSILWLGALSTGVASLIYFNIIQKAGPSFLANMNFMVPVVAYVLGVTILGESATAISLVAIGIIFSGVALTRYKAK
ncbi:DMT family transporter [Neptunomonas phycophila]|uniref:DMT family transporter n=1 Tax=Neptunomonas phycophila TaxID=1572645 RepID=UPI001BE947C7|nr:DMT family transporter [Neptunomonas phycophila]MBT3145966.1 DMT family transporter [Neptunomonas phycophila]